MDTRNTGTPIPLPAIIDDHRWLGRFSREVRKSIAALRDRGQVVTRDQKIKYLHPFKLFWDVDGTDRKLYVAAGRVSLMQWNGTAYPKVAECLVSFNSGKLFADEFSPLSTLGSQTISTSTTYGVWIEVEFFKSSFSNIVSGTAVFNGAVNDIQTIYGNSGGALVRVSTTYTDYDEGTAFANSESANCMFYLGKVEVDADGVVTITQYRKSDICVGLATGTDPLISGDADNAISSGTDGGLWVDATP